MQWQHSIAVATVGAKIEILKTNNGNKISLQRCSEHASMRQQQMLFRIVSWHEAIQRRSSQKMLQL